MNPHKHLPLLAYLSAGGTVRIKDNSLVDESIYLNSTYQLDWFPYVIGTLWEVNDEVCLDMDRLMYEGVREGDITDKSVGLGFHKASRVFRGR
jgi:hypothetical protein